MQNFNEIQQFFIYMIEGSLFGFIFDFFRGFRKNFKSNEITTYIEDIIFLSFASIILIGSVIYFSSGILRFYIFLGISIGVGIYFLTISKKCVIIHYSIIKICKSFFTFVLKIVKKLGNLFHI